MTRVDFYILSDSAGDRLGFTCRLVDKAYQLGHRIYIHTDNDGDAMRLDELLWTFRAASFIPHTRSGGHHDEITPVHIGTSGTPQSSYELLVNLGAEVPPFYDRFARLAEVVAHDESQRINGRRRYREYKEAGCDVHNHAIEK